MSFKDIPPETMKAIMAVAKAINPAATAVHIQQRRVCDHCQDDDREAFPYFATDKNGRQWRHLCNGCFDLLECELDNYWDDDEQI